MTFRGCLKAPLFHKRAGMKLYYAPTTGATAVHIVLEESGLSYEAIDVNFRDLSDPTTVEFRRLNPMVHLPVLVLDDGTVVTQIVAILHLVAELAPHKHLMPAAHTPAYTETLRWLAFLAADLHTAFATDFAWTAIWDTDESSQKARAFWLERLHRRLVIVDEQLGKTPFLAGDYSVVDPYLLVIMGWAGPTELPMQPYTNIRRFLAEMQSRPSVRSIYKREGIAAL